MESGLGATRDLSIINASPKELPGPKFLHELVSSDEATSCPAIDYLDATGTRHTLSYTELHARSAHLAQRISTSLGLCPPKDQPVVALLIPQCPELYIAQLAILKAGAAFCPLNLDAPPERIRFILQDVQASVVVSTPELASRIPLEDMDLARTVLVVSSLGTRDASETSVEERAPLPINTSLKPSDLAYVLYTSGSSGTPKGVGVPHIAATQSLLAHDRHIPNFSRFLQFAAPTFDVSVFEIFFPLYRGKTLVGCNRGDLVDDLPRIIRIMEVDACELTPTVAGSWLRTRAAAPGLKLLLTIGEMLTGPVISEFGGDKDKESILWAMYGPTEAAIHCSLQPSFATDSVPGNIGIPLDSVSLFVVDPNIEDIRILPIGEVGELAIGGHQLARGYINRPEKTSESFVDTPYGVLYRTGDKAMLHENGLLECLGRMSDGQVKLRGQRIELGEIEQVALKTPGCHSAVACVASNTLVLFCAMDDENESSQDEVLQVCREWLPSFMVPGDMKTMQDFPRLPSGKVDRKLLQAQYLEALEQTPASEETFKDDTHQLIHKIASQILGKPISSTASLAASGLDSLLAVRFASELRSHGLNTGAVDILRCRDLLSLHTRLRSPSETSRPVSADDHPGLLDVSLISSIPRVGSEADNISKMTECTPIQAAMLYGSLENKFLYTNWVKLQFPPSASGCTIIGWFQVLSEHNEMLRSGFAYGATGFSRIIWRALSSSQVELVSEFELDAASGDLDSWLLRPFRAQILPSEQGCQVLIHLHHALYDGWSFDSLVTDLSSLATGGTFAPRSSFDRVVAYYYSLPPGERTALEFWTTYLVGCQIPSTPCLRYTAMQQPFGVVRKSVSLTLPNIHKALPDGVHPQALFQAALSCIWAGIVGTDDVIIGSVSSGRMIPVAGIEAIFGPCLTTLPIRVRLSQSRTIEDLIRGIHRSNRDVMQHSTIGLANIKSAVGISPGAPLFDVICVYQESIDSDARRRGCVNEIDRRDFLEANLLVEVEPAQDQFTLRATFHEDFAEESLVRMALDQIDALLCLMVDQPGAEPGALRHALNSKFMSKTNENPVGFDEETSLGKAFQESASNYPDHIALSVLEDNGITHSLNFQDLNSAANKLARQILRQPSLGESPIIAIVMKKSPVLYIAILGVIKAGYAYLPILPETPRERQREILANAGVQACLVDEASQKDDLTHEVTFLVCNDLLGCVSTDDSNIDLPPRPLAPAYVIYTSGTTGSPKGVVVTHRNILSNLQTLSTIYPSSTDSALLQSCSQAFDVSVFEIFWTWLNSMQLCVASNDSLFSDLEGTIQKMGVTHLSMTPTVASLVKREKVPQVRFLVTAGEKMTASVAATWMDVLYQGYGPCESTNICTVTPMASITNPRYLGMPLANTSAFVMAPDSEFLLPMGAIGELVFGGDQIAEGYLNMPELTNQKFITHPQYGRLYRSGDLGRMLPEGGIVISGRLDGQIKLRGQRIELSEVDSAAISFGAVKNAATIAVKVGGSDQLATFYVKDATLSMDEEAHLERDVFHHMRSRLAAYMVPSYLIPVSNLPSTPAGKVDRSRLLTIFDALSGEELASHSVAIEGQDDSSEWTTTETMIAEVVAICLKAEKDSIGKWTPLASLGLDSITAISVSQELSTRSNQKIPISTVLRNPCVSYLAAAMSTKNSQGTPKTTVSMSLDVFGHDFIAKVTAETKAAGKIPERILPCTPLQEAMLTSSNLNSMLFTLHTSDSTMRELWNSMRSRHPILRTCFVVTESERFPIAQIVLSDTEFSFRQYSTDEKTLQQCLEAHETSVPPPIDSLEPPLSLAIIKHGDLLLLSFVCHHALYDGVAIRRLLEEVEKLATGESLTPTPSIEPFLAKSLDLSSDTEGFWTSHFMEFQSTPFPRTRSPVSADPLPDSKPVRVLSEPLQMPLADILSSLKQINASLLSLCQSSWATVVAGLSQSDDVCFGNVMSGRSVAVDGIENLVFPCFNTVPIRMALGANGVEQYSEVVRRFQVLNPILLEYQFTPLRAVQATCGKGGRLFDTLLLLQQPDRDLDERVWTLTRDEGIMDVPLVCEVVPRDKFLEVRLHYTTSLLSPSAAAVAWDIFSLAFTTALQFPQSRIHTYPNMPPDLSRRIEELDLERAGSSEVASSDATLVDDDWTPAELKIRSVLMAFASCSEDRIGKETSIYRLGLDSISAVQVASSLRKDGFAVTATDVIENPTCSALAGKLTTSVPKLDLSADSVSPQPAMENLAHALPASIDSSYIQACLPCTPLQEGLLASFLSSSGRLYLNRISLRTRAQTSGIDLMQAWVSTTTLHPMLRTGFFQVSHEKYNYAMARYKPAKLPVPAKLYTCGGFEVEKWFGDVNRRVLERLDQPPWEVAIVDARMDGEDSDSISVVFHLAIHHALYDAHSLDLIFQDLARCLAAEPVQTVDIDPVLADLHARHQDSEANKLFWSSLVDRVVVNKFPLLTPLLEENPTTDVVTHHVPNFRSLEEAASKANTTVQAVMQAAWGRILSSYHGEASVVFGVVLSGRTTEAMATAAFPCVNTLPVIVAHKPQNRELLEDMMRYNVSLHRHQYSRLSQVQSWIGHPGSAIFDTIVAYQKIAAVESQAAKPFEVVGESADVEYALSLELIPSPDDTLSLQLTYNTQIVPIDAARILVSQFEAIFMDLLYNSEGHEDDLHIAHPSMFSISPPEKPELSSEDGNNIQFLHQFLESSARNHPDRTALEFVSTLEPIAKRTWTYKQVNEMGNRAAHIVANSVPPGEIVAISFTKCPEAYFAILGILKAGCSFVALDPDAPVARKEYIVQDSGAYLVMCGDSPRDLPFESPVPVQRISEHILSNYPPAAPTLSRPLTAQDRSYCLYTSGTTGTPKGCELTHHNAVQALHAFRYLFASRTDMSSKCLQFASLHFDVSILEQYWTWASGLVLSAAPKDLVMDNIVEVINQLDITHIDLTPSLAEVLTPDMVPSLSRGIFITGGESLRQTILDSWGENGVIYNAYGPTEATIGVTMHPRVPRNGRSSNIGKQFLNVGSYILKPNTSVPVLRHGVGELCVSGPLVGKGYLNRPALTDEKFPILEPWGDRVYRTGDLVRILHNGGFDFVGRADDQVKLRGQRLEIGEIDHVIKSVPEVDTVETVVTKILGTDKQVLVSFVVSDIANQHQPGGPLEVICTTQTPLLVQKVLAACRGKLPGYMVPSYVLQLAAIPLSSNNKADTKLLRRMFSETPVERLLELSSAPPQSAPVSQTLKRILGVLQELNYIQHDVSGEATIFELGIDSISALRFSGALRSAGFEGATTPLVLRNPVLSDLAACLEEEHTEDDTEVLEAKHRIRAAVLTSEALITRVLEVTSDQIESIAPCSALQQGMISRSLENDAGHYFNTFRFELGVHVDISQLRDAWNRATDACSILRTRFVAGTDGHVQVALKTSQVWKGESSLHLDPDELPAADTFLKALRESWVRRNKEHIVDPAQVRIFSLGQDRPRVMVVNLFHGLYDGTSLEMILQHVTSEYHGERPAYGPNFLDVLPFGPLRQRKAGKDFWKDRFSNAAFTRIQESPQAQPFAGPVTASTILDFALIETAGKRLAVAHQAVVQALWARVLESLMPSGATMGIVLSGRALEVDGAEFAVGPLFNTIPFHLAASDRPATWDGLIKVCHEFNTAVLPFQHTPLRDIQKWCNAGRPMFDVLFAFQKETVSPLGAPPLWKEVDAGEEPDPDYPLAFEATARSDGTMKILLVAQESVFDAQRLRSLLSGFQTALESLASGTEATVDDIIGLVPLVDHGPPGDDTKDVQESTQPATVSFQWTPLATLLRCEIANLAKISSESVSPSTSILELGLDSIDAIKLSSRLKQKGVVVSRGQLLRGMTIANIMAYVGSTSSALPPKDTLTKPTSITSSDSGLISLSERLHNHLTVSGHDLHDVDTVLPPTPLQDAMVADMLNSNFDRYFNHDVLAISPDVDIPRLEQAWQTVIEHTPVLRTVFQELGPEVSDFGFAQTILRPRRWNISHYSLGTVEQIQTVIKIAKRKAKNSWGKGDLLQLALITVGDDELAASHFLVLSIAHALYDGQSLVMLHRDVEAAYDNRYHPRPDYRSHLGKIVEAGGHKQAIQFWKSYLSGVVPSVIQPAESTTGSTPSSSVVHRIETTSTLPPVQIKEFCRQQRITLQSFGQAVWAVVLATHVQSVDVVFGTVLSGRSDDVAENIMFPTMNTVPVRALAHGQVGEFLRYVQQNSALIGEWEHSPLRVVRRAAGVEGELFNSLFLVQMEEAAGGGEGERLGLMRSVESAAEVEYPVCVEMQMEEAGLAWRVACRGEYFDENGTRRLVEELESTAKFLVDNPQEEVVKFASGGRASLCGSAGFQVAEKKQPPRAEAPGLSEDEDWTEPATTIRNVLAQAAGIPPQSVQKTHSLYHLGLDSISAIKVAALLRREGIVLGAHKILAAGSVGQMGVLARTTHPDKVRPQGPSAPALGRSGTGEEEDPSPAPGAVADLGALLQQVGMQPDEFEHVLPATPLQAHMLSVWQNTEGSLFFPTFTYEMSGRHLGSKQVVQACRMLLVQVPILRTSLLATRSGTVPVVQVVRKADQVQTESTVVGGVRQHRVSMLPHDTLPSLIHIAIGDVGGNGAEENRVAVKLTIHHALYDGVSLPLLVSQMKSYVTGESALTNNAHFGAWCTFVMEHSDPGALAVRQKFWTAYLAGYQPAPFPKLTDKTPSSSPTSATTPRTSIFRSSILGKAAVKTLKSVSANAGVSVQALFFAAYAQVLASSVRTARAVPARPTNDDDDDGDIGDGDVVLGIYLANRSSESLSAIPFPTLNLLPLRVRLGNVGGAAAAAAPGPGDLVEAARRVQRDLGVLGDPANAAAGLWEIEAWTGVAAVETFVNFLALPEATAEHAGDGREEEEEDGSSVSLRNLTAQEYLRYGLENEEGSAGLEEGETIPSPLPLRRDNGYRAPAVEGNSIRRCYPDAVDIEVAIRDGEMDIGVFGPRGMVDEEGALGLIEKLSECLGMGGI